jgi:hypothetical protein
VPRRILAIALVASIVVAAVAFGYWLRGPTTVVAGHSPAAPARLTGFHTTAGRPNEEDKCRNDGAKSSNSSQVATLF